MDPFARFPTEIIWQILESCCDFTSLDGLQQISPRMEQAFNGSFKNITESVLRNCSHASEGLHCYFTLLASIQSMPFTPETLLEELNSLPGNAEQPISLPTYHSLVVVRHTVGIAAKIHLTACACLQYLLNRLESAKPRLPLGSTSDITEWIYRRLPPPRAGEVIQFDVDPPSWIESYRTHRSLWELEIFRQIHNIAIKHWSWSTHDMDNFTERYLETFHCRERLQELQTVSECVVDLCSSKPLILSHQTSPLIAIPSPKHLTLKTCWPLPKVEDTPVNIEWSRCRFPGSLLNSNGSSAMFRFLSGGANGHDSHPLRQLDFKAFRRLGVPLWDYWRLCQMGLVRKSRRTLSPHGNIVGGQFELNKRSHWVTTYIWFSLAESDVLE